MYHDPTVATDISEIGELQCTFRVYEVTSTRKEHVSKWPTRILPRTLLPKYFILCPQLMIESRTTDLRLIWFDSGVENLPYIKDCSWFWISAVNIAVKLLGFHVLENTAHFLCPEIGYPSWPFFSFSTVCPEKYCHNHCLQHRSQINMQNYVPNRNCISVKFCSR